MVKFGENGRLMNNTNGELDGHTNNLFNTFSLLASFGI
jgi:hypothetical protein